MKEIKAHTGLRGVAAVVVMLGHLSLDYFFAGFSTVVMPFLFGNAAVDLFFILSGFILCYVYAVPGESRPCGGYRNYHAARFARVYPLHFATLLAVGALAVAGRWRGQITGDYRLVDFFRQVFLVNSYPVIGNAQTWNFPAWSISIEYLAYLAFFPLFLRWRPARVSARWTVACIGLLTLAEIGCLRGVVLWQDEQKTLWLAVLRGFVGFGTGCLLHDLFAFHPACTRWFQRYATVWVAAALALVALAGSGWCSPWWVLLTWPPLVLALTSGTGWASRLLSTRAALFFGNLSYSLYMLHVVVRKVASATIFRRPDLLPTPWLQVAGVGFVLGIVGLSWLSFRFFEMPVRFWLRTWLNREPANVGPPSAAVAGGGEGVRHGRVGD